MSQNKTATAKNAPKTNLRRRLYGVKGPVKNSRQQGLGFKKSPNSVLGDTQSQRNTMRVTSVKVATFDENGDPTTIYYDEHGNRSNTPFESEFLVNDDDVNLSSDSNSNSTSQHISSETKNENSGLSKARDQLTVVADDR